MTKETEDLRSPEAKARDSWLESKEGQACCNGTTSGQYLQNRLERAFAAGLDVGIQIANQKKPKARRKRQNRIG